MPSPALECQVPFGELSAFDVLKLLPFPKVLDYVVGFRAFLRLREFVPFLKGETFGVFTSTVLTWFILLNRIWPDL